MRRTNSPHLSLQPDSACEQGPLDDPPDDADMQEVRRGIMTMMRGSKAAAPSAKTLAGSKHLAKLKIGERGVTTVGKVGKG